jgi:hypothetical protein
MCPIFGRADPQHIISQSDMRKISQPLARRILEAIRVADELIWNEIQILAAEDVRLAGGEICE